MRFVSDAEGKVVNFLIGKDSPVISFVAKVGIVWMILFQGLSRFRKEVLVVSWEHPRTEPIRIHLALILESIAAIDVAVIIDTSEAVGQMIKRWRSRRSMHKRVI